MSEFGEYDDFALKRIKDFTVAKYQETISLAVGPILEIGPSILEGAKNSPIFSDNLEWFIDGRREFEKVNKEYLTMDIDPSVSANFTASIEDNLTNVINSRFNSIICFSVLEHCRNPFKAVSNIHKLLNPGGSAYFLTPWDLRFHGPRPDCWRISDDGYEALMGDSFRISKMEKCDNSLRPLSPYAMFVVAVAT